MSPSLVKIQVDGQEKNQNAKKTNCDDRIQPSRQTSSVAGRCPNFPTSDYVFPQIDFLHACTGYRRSVTAQVPTGWTSIGKQSRFSKEPAFGTLDSLECLTTRGAAVRSKRNGFATVLTEKAWILHTPPGPNATHSYHPNAGMPGTIFVLMRSILCTCDCSISYYLRAVVASGAVRGHLPMLHFSHTQDCQVIVLIVFP